MEITAAVAAAVSLAAALAALFLLKDARRGVHP